jgi:DNA-binding winged helix-turn-helix (wHTH) protein
VAEVSPQVVTIEFAFPDFYENIKWNKANIDQPTGSVKVEARVTNAKLEELETKTFASDIGQRIKELKSVNAVPKVVNPKVEELKTKTFDFPLINVYAGVLALLGASLLIGYFRKNLKTVPGQNQHHAVMKEPNPELAALGSFLFNVKGQRLLLGSEAISLTDKECKVLELLHKNFGELISRETLMQEVWINEGVFTGRSLDMFVSKLRKKLSSDPELRITNVHGKGYKLEIPERQII